MDITTLFNIDLPIIQAPMAGVQGSPLAIAVSNAGGLGSLPCAMLTPALMHAELIAIRASTHKPFNVNFFSHINPPPLEAIKTKEWIDLLQPYYQELAINSSGIPMEAGRKPFDQASLDILNEFRPPVVSFHFGLPDQALLSQLRTWGAKIISSATTVKEALWLEAQGVDAIIAQGLEAGGHRGMFLSDDLTTQVGCLALLPQIVRAVNVPVIAAGGIASAQGVKAVLGLGAIAAQIGTAYLLCPEAFTGSLHRAALVSDQAEHTALTNLFTGRPARGIVNRLMTELGYIHSAAPAFPLASSAIAPLRLKAESQGSSDFTPLWAGQNTRGCKPISATALTHELASLVR